MNKLIALATSQGTACSETVLTPAEDSPSARKQIEEQFCKGRGDDPLPGTWTDVTENECFADLLD